MKKLSRYAKNLWGKKATQDKTELWLPLIAHMIDTKNVINWLYNHWLNQGQRNLFLQNMSDIDVQKLVRFLGYIHDIGKATPAFQTKESYNHDRDLDYDLLEHLLRNGFTNLDQLHLANARRTPHALAGEAILEREGLNTSVGAIIGGHHGKPQNDDSLRNVLEIYTSNFYQTDTPPNSKNHWLNVQKELINYGLNICGYDDIQSIPKVKQPQAVLLEGLVIMADWLASSEYLNDNFDKPMFTLIPLQEDFDNLDMKQRFRNALMTWYQNDVWQPDPVSDVAKEYQDRFNFTPRVVQKTMSEAIGNISDPGIVIVEAPMGIGKTEIALTAVEQIAGLTGRNGLFFGLPTQATTNAMFSRVDNWLTNIATSENTNIGIKLMHGKAQFNDEYRELPKAENVDTSGSVVINSWFSGKKTILEKFTIGTIDQLLLMGLKQKHLFLRHLGLSGKIVVIDEVHAYDIYMDSYLLKAIEWLGAYHVPVIALSATLSARLRKNLVRAYVRGKYSDPNKYQAEVGWQDNNSYPLLTFLDGQRLNQVDKFDNEGNNKTVVKVKRLQCDDEELINHIQDNIKDGGIAGVIVNTIKRAQDLAQLIPTDIPVLILHSAFLATDRSKLEQKLQSLIGKKAKRPDKLIVIGTQVLEQSLDIDFDVLYTDIAPMDLILQRIGRLHRHQIKRPLKLACPQVFIMGINSWGDYGDANEAIYDKYLLMKTDYFLPDQITLPIDISCLVQKVYSKENDSEIGGISQVKQNYLDKRKKLRKRASVFQIKPPFINFNIHGWLDNNQPGVSKNEERAQAAVRDTKETIEILLLKKTETGVCLLNGKSIEEDQVSSKEIARQIIRLPHAVTFNIDESIDKLETITSEKYPEWQNDIWLKSALALTLDENNNVEFNGWQLHYSKKIGLTYTKEAQN